jgi:endo-1,3(4)-beta-glucanase
MHRISSHVLSACQHVFFFAKVWISADKALAPLLYDAAWGGAVSCGCYFDPSGEGKCGNKVSGTDCPGLYDLGQNFGQGFFQDHHFHFGYHLYAAAVVRLHLPVVGSRYCHILSTVE